MTPKGYFINISKTGGTSISSLIIDALPSGAVVTDYGTDAQHDRFGHVTEASFLSHIAQYSDESMAGIRAFVGHLPLIPRARLPFSVRYVMLLRDPLARLISAHSYSMQGRQIPRDFYDFGLHLSATYWRSDSWENPVAKFLLKKDDVELEDWSALTDVVADFDIVGTTATLNSTCRVVFATFGWGMPGSPPRVNETFHVPLDSVPAETVRVIRKRNQIDYLLYDSVAVRSKSAAGVPPREVTEGSFSSGDYHQELASDFAFSDDPTRCWHSSAHLLGSEVEYIGYEFAQPRGVPEIWLQLAMRPGQVVKFAIEVSADGFRRDVRDVGILEMITGPEGRTFAVASAAEARSWRLRRLFPRGDEALTVAGLAFGNQRRPAEKSVELCRETVDRIRAHYNIDSYAQVLDES